MTHPAPAPESTGTRQRILDAALHVFAQRGFDGATLKEITERAGANIAAVNYYFSAKDELARQVLATFVSRVNARRLEALDRCIAAGPLRLEPLIQAVVAPMIDLSSDQAGGRALVRLILQVRALPNHALTSVLVEQFNPVHERFIEAFQQVLPHLAREDIIWRYDFARGAMMQILGDIDPDVQRLSSLGMPYGSAHLTDETILLQLVNFIAAGFMTPPMDAKRLKKVQKLLG